MVLVGTARIHSDQGDCLRMIEISASHNRKPDDFDRNCDQDALVGNYPVFAADGTMPAHTIGSSFDNVGYKYSHFAFPDSSAII